MPLLRSSDGRAERLELRERAVVAPGVALRRVVHRTPLIRLGAEHRRGRAFASERVAKLANLLQEVRLVSSRRLLRALQGEDRVVRAFARAAKFLLQARVRAVVSLLHERVHDLRDAGHLRGGAVLGSGHRGGSRRAPRRRRRRALEVTTELFHRCRDGAHRGVHLRAKLRHGGVFGSDRTRERDGRLGQLFGGDGFLLVLLLEDQGGEPELFEGLREGLSGVLVGDPLALAAHAGRGALDVGVGLLVADELGVLGRLLGVPPLSLEALASLEGDVGGRTGGGGALDNLLQRGHLLLDERRHRAHVLHGRVRDVVVVAPGDNSGDVPGARRAPGGTREGVRVVVHDTHRGEGARADVRRSRCDARDGV